MIDLRKILIIAIIAVLFVVLCFAVTSSIYERPDYEDFCGRDMYYAKPVPPSQNCTGIAENPALAKECGDNKGMVEYKYDTNGCIVEEYCNTCMVGYNEAQRIYNMYVFVVFSILGLIAIVAGLYLSPETNELNKWVGTGFIAGGLAALFVGTAHYYSDMIRYYRPVVLAIELAIVIYVFYREMSLYSRMVQNKPKPKSR